MRSPERCDGKDAWHSCKDMRGLIGGILRERLVQPCDVAPQNGRHRVVVAGRDLDVVEHLNEILNSTPMCLPHFMIWTEASQCNFVTSS
jgi:hypothetical protein